MDMNYSTDSPIIHGHELFYRWSNYTWTWIILQRVPLYMTMNHSTEGPIIHGHVTWTIIQMVQLYMDMNYSTDGPIIHDHEPFYRGSNYTWPWTILQRISNKYITWNYRICLPNSSFSHSHKQLRFFAVFNSSSRHLGEQLQFFVVFSSLSRHSRELLVAVRLATAYCLSLGSRWQGSCIYSFF